MWTGLILRRFGVNRSLTQLSASTSSKFEVSSRSCSNRRPHQDKFDEQDDVLKREILRTALGHVNIHGWTTEAIRAGAKEMGLSEELGNAFTEFDLFRNFNTDCNDDLEEHLKEQQLKLGEALKWRLEKVVPYVPGYADAIAKATKPQNLPESVKLLQNLSDSIAYHALRDRSANISWYSLRAGIASVYVASELHLVQDRSTGFEETWKFVDRRVQDFQNLRIGSIGNLPQAIPEVLSIGCTTLMNIIGRNARR